MKLFMFYVGGNFANSNIELHDVRFSVGATPEDCYADLRRQWWGDLKSLHLDCWGTVEQADGFDVSLTSGPTGDPSLRLFFVNLGGYDPQQFGELHRNVLIVAADAPEAKRKALAQINDWMQPHKDRLFEVEQAVDLTTMAEQSGFIITLTRATSERPFVFECLYLPIG